MLKTCTGLVLVVLLIVTIYTVKTEPPATIVQITYHGAKAAYQVRDQSFLEYRGKLIMICLWVGQITGSVLLYPRRKNQVIREG